MQPRKRQVPPYRCVPLDDCRLETKLSGADRCDVTAGTASDDRNIEGGFLRHFFLSAAAQAVRIKKCRNAPREAADRI